MEIFSAECKVDKLVDSCTVATKVRGKAPFLRALQTEQYKEMALHELANGIK